MNDYSKEYNYFDGEIEEKYLLKDGGPLISWSASLGVFIWDILFSKDGTVGKVMEVLEEKDQVVLSSIAILRPNKKIILPTFLAEYLKTEYALNQASDKKSGSAIRRIILKDIKTIKIPLPLISEQEDFIKRINLVYSLKEHQRKSTDDINQLFDALMQKAFKGELAG